MTDNGENNGIPALLVERLDPGQKESYMSELKALAVTAGYRIVGTITQQRRPHPGYLLGKGKVEELKETAQEAGAEKILFQNILTASQAFHLEDKLGVGVGDRGDVILEIFARRARTPEARMQVELARAMYELPRARAKVTSRVGTEQPGFMGAGRFGYDVYERHLNHRIAELRHELTIIGGRDTHRRSRRRGQGFDLVALAGYTNAGKSSLLNAITGVDVNVDDEVFTTLSTTTRAVKINGRRILLSDTVGFIRDLPPFLLRAFRTTLEEVLQADLVVIVVDAGEPIETVSEKLFSTLDTLRNVGLHAPLVCAINKVDLLPDELRTSCREAVITASGGLFKTVVFTSASTSEGLEELLAAVEESLPGWERGKVELPVEERDSLLAWLYREGRVSNVDDGVAVWEAPPAAWGKLKKKKLAGKKAGAENEPGTTMTVGR